MVFEILDDKGKVINTINADLAFVEEHYPGHYRDVTPPPTPEPMKRILTRFQFRSLFTFAEMVAITTAAKTDVGVEVFMKSMEVAEEVDLDYPEVAQGLDYLILRELIPPEKKQQILG